MIRRIVKQNISLMLIGTQIVWAAPIPAIDIRPAAETPAFFQIEIPEDLASVDEVYEAPAALSPKVILHIQNIHGNYQAQVQVKKMLDYFYKQYGFKTIFVEGAAEKLDAKYLSFFPDKKDNLELADNMARKGQLTGPELYLMEAPEDVRALGIEQTDLYRGNYDAFRQVYGAKNQTDSFLKLLDSRLELLSSRFLTRDMRRILSEWQKFHQGRREFLSFVKNLAVESQKFLNLDLNSLFAQVEWPQTARLLVLQSMEADLKHDEALRERDQLLEFLQKNHASETLLQGIKGIEGKTINLQRLANGKGEDPFEPRKLLERLAGEAAPMGFQFHQYPNFSLYAGYLILQSELDSKDLFQEIEKLFARILDSLTVSEKEKNLLELYKDLELLKKLLSLELTRSEWDQATYRKNWIKPKSLVERLEKMSLNGFVTEQLEVLKEVPAVFDAAFQFYDFARQREFAFYDVIEREMTSEKTDRAILVTGGFHTDGLSEIFRSKQINYGILTPRIGGEFDKTDYIQSMMELHPTRFDLAQLEMVNALQSIVEQVQQGADPGEAVKLRLDIFASGLEAIAHSPRIAVKDTDAIAELIDFYNQHTEFNREGAGFQRLPSEDGNPRYWYRAVQSVAGTVTLGPLTNRAGKPLIFLVNPNFKGSLPLVIDPVEPGFLETLHNKKDARGRKEPLTLSFNVPEPSRISEKMGPSIQSKAGAMRAALGQLPYSIQARRAGSRLDDEKIPSFDDLSGAAFHASPPGNLSDAIRGMNASFTKRLQLADARLEKGRPAEDVVTALSGSVNSESFAGFIQELTASDTPSVTLEGIVDKLADQGTIPESHRVLLKFILKKSVEPGALILRLNSLPENPAEQQKQLQAMSARLKLLLEENTKQYVTLILPEGMNEQRVAVIQSEFQSIEQSNLGIRFNILAPERLDASEVFRLMITLMQRVGDLKRGSIYNHVEQHGALYTEQGRGATPDAWKDFYARMIHQETLQAGDARIPKDKGIAFYAEVLMLGAWLAAALSRIDPAEVDQKLLDLLSRDDERTYHLNEQAALGLVVSMLAVLQAFSASA